MLRGQKASTPPIAKEVMDLPLYFEDFLSNNHPETAVVK